jgi:uncharacterized protein (TIGR03435 family)
MIAECFASKLSFGRKMLSNLAVAFVVALPLVSGLVSASHLRAQSAAPASAPDIAATWQGTLHGGQALRTVLKVTKADSGYKADFYSIDQGAQPIPVTRITLDGTTLKYNIIAFDLKYEGKLSADGNTIEGSSTQGGNALPLTFTRATPATEWAIPKPPPPIPPMSADAKPTFEVATIKPTKPDEQGRRLIWTGRRMETVNTPLSFLISFAYGMHAKQIIGIPPWADTEKFDITAQPDLEGQPSDKQLKAMVQKMLADRFKLSFHHDTKELSVYVLSVTKTGNKLTKSEADPNGLPGLFFRGLGKLNVRNATMNDFTGLMQNAVLDRPVVDQTGLTGRFDFTLNWTPDDSQFGGMGAKVPPPTDAADAPPNLYTAIQEQIGLKLDATKAPADVLMIDHVEEPSAN